MKQDLPSETMPADNTTGYSYSGSESPAEGYSHASESQPAQKAASTPSEFAFGAAKVPPKEQIQPATANSYSYASESTAPAAVGYSATSSTTPEVKIAAVASEFAFAAAKTASKAPVQAEYTSGSYANGGYSQGFNSGAPAPAQTKPPSFSSASEGYSYSERDAKAPAAAPRASTHAGPSPDASPQRDWTQEMYSHLSDVQKRSLRTSGNLIENPDKYVERGTTVNSLIDVAASFTSMATRHGTTIIEEKFKPADARTIKSQNVGGVAGGEKYIHDGIFFKFAVDDHGLYGDLERAMKTAGRLYFLAFSIRGLRSSNCETIQAMK
jgi:hypothetical protein